MDQCLIMLVIYFLALVIIISGGVAVYLKCRSWGGARAASLGLFISALLTVIWPLPIHGGFTFFGEIVYFQIKNWQRKKEHIAEVQQQNAFVERFKERFSAPLVMVSQEPLSGTWWRASIDSGIVYYEAQSHLIWSKPQPFETASPLSSLPAAKAICRNLSPQGAWSLPTEGEQYYFWRASGAVVLPDGGASAIAILVDETFQLEMPTVNLGQQSNNNTESDTAIITFPIRCVARSEQAPRHGYLDKDIPRDEWNHYQLSKTTSQ